MSRLRRPAIVAGIVGLFATVVLSGVSAQEPPPVSAPELCETVDQAPPASMPDGVPVTVPPTSSTLPTVPSTLPAAPVETPTAAQLPEDVPQPPCQPTTPTTLPPLEDEEEEEYWEEFFEDAGFSEPTYSGSLDFAPYEAPVDSSTGGFTGEVAAVPVPTADTTDAQPIASGGGGFRYALVFMLPLLMLLAAAAVAWTLTQPVTAAVKA